MSTFSLPDDPSLERLRNQARPAARTARRRDPQAIALIAAHHPAGVPADIERRLR